MSKLKTRICQTCGNSYVRTIKHKSFRNCENCKGYCRVHGRVRSSEELKILTLRDFFRSDSVKGKHPSWRSAHVRNLNRSWNKELLKSPCKLCGYSKHVELAHIKAITSFPESTLISEVNSPENVVQLCPNCHWELDHGLVSLN